MNSSILRLASIVCLSLATVALAQPQKDKDPYPQLPEGQGRATFINTCNKCHAPTIVASKGQSRQGWEETVVKMVGMGATGTDEEFGSIVDYLVKNFPAATKINVNKATAAEIESKLGFTATQSQDIVTYREKAGSFKSADDLKKVPQLDVKDVEAKLDRMTFE